MGWLGTIKYTLQVFLFVHFSFFLCLRDGSESNMTFFFCFTYLILFSFPSATVKIHKHFFIWETFFLSPRLMLCTVMLSYEMKYFR